MPSQRLFLRAFWMCCSFLVLLPLSACGRLAPAIVPAQLAQTPGPPVMIDDDVYRSTAFAVTAPPGWEIVTSPAYSPPWVVFISPDEDAVMVVAVNESDTDVMPPQPEGQTVRTIEQVQLENGESVFAALITSAQRANDYETAFHTVLASLNSRNRIK